MKSKKMQNRNIIYKFLLLICLFVAPCTLFPQSATLNFTTVTTGSGYAPYHVLAVWITDINGNNLRTIDCRATTYKTYLTNWKASFKGGTADASTGATLGSHAARSYVWNYKSRDGGTVPDGMYYLNVEFNESSGAKYVQYLFTKSSTVEKTYTFTNSTYFNNVSVIVSVPADAPLVSSKQSFGCLYNSLRRELLFDFDAVLHPNVKLELFNLNGISLVSTRLNDEKVYSVSHLSKGIYLARLTDDRKVSQTFRIVVR